MLCCSDLLLLVRMRVLLVRLRMSGFGAIEAIPGILHQGFYRLPKLRLGNTHCDHRWNAAA